MTHLRVGWDQFCPPSLNKKKEGLFILESTTREEKASEICHVDGGRKNDVEIKSVVLLYPFQVSRLLTLYSYLFLIAQKVFSSSCELSTLARRRREGEEGELKIVSCHFSFFFSSSPPLPWSRARRTHSHSPGCIVTLDIAPIV